MAGAPRNAEFYTIIRGAVVSLGESTIAERNEIYHCARQIIVNFDNFNDSIAVHRKTQKTEEIEEVLALVETEYRSRQAQIISSHGPTPLAPQLVMDVGLVPNPELDIVPDTQSHERTALFLKNIGAGGTVSIVKILIQLALLPLMAHLLGPKEFGVYALAVPVVAFLAVIADGGVGLSLARDRANAPEVWSTAFWVLMLSGLMLSVVVVTSGYLLSLASSEPQLNSLMLILAMSFPFLSLSVLPVARLTRSGNLVACATADFASTVAGAACAVGLGMMGFGAMSLAFQFLIGYIVRAVILNLYAFERPAAIFRPSAMLSHLSSGGILMGGRVADLACRSGESLLFGNAFGAGTLGAYNFANQVPRFLFEAFSNPSWSALYAHSLNEQHERLLQIYYKVCRLMAFVTFPTAAVLTAASPEILAHVLGPSWEQAGVFLRILAPGYALSITASMGTALLLALNANLTFFFTTVFLGIGRVAAVAAGHYLPAWQSVWLVTVSNIIYAVVVCSFVVRVADARFVSIAKEIAGSFIASLVSGAVCWGILKLVGGGFVVLCAAILAAALCYFAAMFAIEGKNLKNEFTFLRSAMAGIIKKDR
ncbi:oligosaccharide flippase family protein [Methylobacterium sp. WL64]|uniref:oligosaccharide flippase family protein n=1 Tax=Methylobacterium sp. WL64 TaxID=2603894 RepID=UPI0011C786F8|nr:oligosaccharide flippase family protein [Methylobacterium sp. WL64]TXM98241.1 oligosaccharide flippase family protein [Methylobacterium sp. WL64]